MVIPVSWQYCHWHKRFISFGAGDPQLAINANALLSPSNSVGRELMRESVTSLYLSAVMCIIPCVCDMMCTYLFANCHEIPMSSYFGLGGDIWAMVPALLRIFPSTGELVGGSVGFGRIPFSTLKPNIVVMRQTTAPLGHQSASCTLPIKGIRSGN